MTFDISTGTPLLTKPGSGFTAAISTMNPGSIEEQAEAAWAEILFQIGWLSETEVEAARVLWLKLPGGKGLKVESWGDTIAVAPAYFDATGSFLFWDNSESEFISPAPHSLISPRPESDITRLIRRARKLGV